MTSLSNPRLVSGQTAISVMVRCSSRMKNLIVSVGVRDRSISSLSAVAGSQRNGAEKGEIENFDWQC
jgi:hypothetical protein